MKSFPILIRLACDMETNLDVYMKACLLFALSEHKKVTKVTLHWCAQPQWSEVAPYTEEELVAKKTTSVLVVGGELQVATFLAKAAVLVFDPNIPLPLNAAI